MGLIALVNSDRTVLGKVRGAFRRGGKNLGYSVRVIAAEHRVQESLNYDLPELVMINCGDPVIRLSAIADQVRRDSWLHSFGIIGLYDSSKQDEKALAEELRDLNLLVMLDYSRIRSHLLKCVSIIIENWQLIFQKEVSNRLVENMSGSFLIENDTLAVPIYASIPVTNLVQMGFLHSEDKMGLQLALSELIVNAIEHGNCGITYEEKSAGMAHGLSVVDLVMEKCTDPEINKKRVRFTWESDKKKTKFVIRDEGLGFDVSSMRQKTASQDPYAFHGRGIKMAELFCSELSYNDKGNEVSFTVYHSEGDGRQTPEGFSGEEVICPSKGDQIFSEGEQGDFLYYISSGHFSVYHKGHQVGILTPADIFMGEMSFLLNNRRSATVIADEDAKLVKISRKSFVEVMKHYPYYGIFLSKLLARKLARSNEERTALA
ncbi:cyclic nucleotide-binding domain-containing protein [Sediminispirochaeta bajacaliforniensis]|uniref:cyclic nucleotide-binding domain-containing protein n=1 Tax=Sediminispirochaeta bajacaliforniensis TaxID=148 RepID=UPI00037B6B13|nr:cyclic nucleotide-binding domain-containing protein [Sediminispirochaeta bajacaliforniensis]